MKYRTIKSLKIVDHGKSVLIQNSRHIGPKIMKIPSTSFTTLSKAYTGFGENGAEKPIPKTLTWYQKPIFLWTQTYIPVKIQGMRGIMKLDREGRFTNIEIFDALFHAPENNSNLK